MCAKKAVPQTYKNLWPLPVTTVLVSCVGKSSKPNIITIGACGIASAKPPLISLAIGVWQYSLGLIKEMGDFIDLHNPYLSASIRENLCAIL